MLKLKQNFIFIEFYYRFYKNQESDMDWTKERHIRMLTLRQEALDNARKKWADYILVGFLYPSFLT